MKKIPALAPCIAELLMIGTCVQLLVVVVEVVLFALQCWQLLLVVLVVVLSSPSLVLPALSTSCWPVVAELHLSWLASCSSGIVPGVRMP